MGVRLPSGERAQLLPSYLLEPLLQLLLLTFPGPIAALLDSTRFRRTINAFTHTHNMHLFPPPPAPFPPPCGHRPR